MHFSDIDVSTNWIAEPRQEEVFTLLFAVPSPARFLQIGRFPRLLR
jgi:hypothetical protein